MTHRFLRFALPVVVMSAWIGVTQAEAITTNDGTALSGSSSLSGSYLAARSADSAQDLQAAATYFGAALDNDPENPVLLERVLILRVANGEIDLAASLADRLIAIDAKNPLARLVLAIRALKSGDYSEAHSQLTQTAKAPLAVLTGGLLSAWAEQGLGKVDDALKTIDGLSGPTWYGIFKDYHHGLIADLAGRTDEAVAAISRAFNTDGSALRVVESYGRILTRAGERAEAIAGLNDFALQQPNHPIIKDLLAALQSGQTPPPLVSTPQQGAAEVLYGLGAAIGTDDGTELPAAYLRFANYLDPNSHLALMALGDLMLTADRCEDAIAAYGAIPNDSRIKRNAEIQIGLCLDSIDRTDEAAVRLSRVIDTDPADLEAVTALGNIYRGRNRFAEAAAAYTRGIDTIKNPGPTDWRIFYFRGVSLERDKRWPEAEADLKKSLELSPDQPQVLNYLGYSWVDMGLNLDKALDMIRTAVDLRPNDGYIVDSLGWAYYKLSRYEEAVEQLERAVELKPADSVINDHLGDAYWKVGRKLEATFQWSHARDLDPEPTERDKIVKKLENGISADAGNDG